MNSRDVHDESSVDSLLCLLLDLLGDAKQHASTRTQCLTWSVISEAFHALNTIFDLYKIHVGPGCRFVDHEMSF